MLNAVTEWTKSSKNESPVRKKMRIVEVGSSEHVYTWF